MFRHNLTLALRNQLKNKAFSIINVLGLAIGLSVSILIINYVSFEFSYDNMHSKRDRIYRVESRFYEGNILTDDWATSTFGYGSAINREMTGVENFVRIGVQNSEQTVSYKEIRSRENGIAYTGPSFFSVFDFKLKTGAINDQLVRPNTVVITEDIAIRFFKDENPIGKVLTFATGTTFYNCEVTGILRNLPKNSHIRFNYLISYETLPVWMKDFWYLHEAYTYLLLVPGKNPKEIESQFPVMAEKYKTMNALKNKTWAVNLVPLKDIHLNPQKQYEREIKGNKKSLITLIFIAIVILLTAWINYINLTTARSMERAKDIGIRKVSGAFRRQLIGQFLLESWIVNLFSIIGVLKNWHQRGLGNAYTPVMLLKNGRISWVPPRFIAIKTTDNKYDKTLEMIHKQWSTYFPDASFDYFFLDSYFDSQYKSDRLFGKIVSIFTGLAFFISVLGLWGLASFTASKKVKDVGIRKIFGARIENIVYQFSKEIVVLILIALLIATPISILILKNWLLNFAFRITIPYWIYLTGGIITLSVAMITVCLQSWKTATRNPVEALRYE